MSPKGIEDIGREPEAMKKAYAALKDLGREEQTRVLEWLVKKLDVGFALLQSEAGRLGGQGGPQQPPLGGLGIGQSPPGPPPTSKVFLNQKKPTSNVERVACLGYYLTHHRSLPLFKTADLTKLNTDAAQPKISNPSQAVKDATKSQYLTAAGGGKKQITSRGEALVEALPDETKVKQALTENPLIKYRPKKKTKKS